MQNNSSSQIYLDSRKFKLMYDYYSYLFCIENRKPKKTSFSSINLLKYLSNKFESHKNEYSYLSQSMYTILYLSIFNQFDLIKMKISNNLDNITIKHIFYEIVLEKKNLLSKKIKNREVGIFESFLRLNFSKGIFIPSALVNQCSFYLVYKMNYDKNYNHFSEDKRVILSFILNCLILLPIKALQYQTLTNLNNESIIIKDYLKFFSPRYIMKGLVGRFELNLSKTLPTLFIENVFGMSIFFRSVNSPYVNDCINYIMDDTDQKILYANDDLMKDIIEANPRIRRSIYFTEEQKILDKNKVSLFTREILRGMISGMFTGLVVSLGDLCVKFFLGELNDANNKKGKIGFVTFKLNVLKFIMQYGICFSFLRFYDETNFLNNNKN